jgi:mRNA-degrading endonuclease RelE of RelBE toxin-antitoxin system
MSYKLVLLAVFKRSVKRLEKRYRTVKEDVKTAIRQLQDNPRVGDVIPGGEGTRKLRVRNTTLSKGQRGGYRLIYYVVDDPEPIIYLLFLYAKSDKAAVTRAELKTLLDDLAQEL